MRQPQKLSDYHCKYLSFIAHGSVVDGDLGDLSWMCAPPVSFASRVACWDQCLLGEEFLLLVGVRSTNSQATSHGSLETTLCILPANSPVARWVPRRTQKQWGGTSTPSVVVGGAARWRGSDCRQRILSQEERGSSWALIQPTVFC